MTGETSHISVRQITPADVPAVVDLQRRVYPVERAWSAEELTQHLAVFPEGQLVAVNDTERVVGSASSLLSIGTTTRNPRSGPPLRDAEHSTRITRSVRRSMARTCASIQPRASVASARISTTRARNSSASAA